MTQQELQQEAKKNSTKNKCFILARNQDDGKGTEIMLAGDGTQVMMGVTFIIDRISKVRNCSFEEVIEDIKWGHQQSRANKQKKQEN